MERKRNKGENNVNGMTRKETGRERLLRQIEKVRGRTEEQREAA